MKKTNLIFLLIILSEVVLSIVFLLLGNPCGSACDPHSLLNPFGYVTPSKDPIAPACHFGCTYTPHPLFYIVADLLILTIIAYGLYLVVKLMRKLNIT